MAEDQRDDALEESAADEVAPAPPSDGDDSDDDSTYVLSPYAGGGGGTVLAHRVATLYLADLLLGAGRPETDGLPVVRVAFQTNPTDPVDDLRVEAERDDDKVVVHIAGRRTPNFTQSHTKTAELVGTLLDQIDTFGTDDRAYVAVALVAMSNPHREVQRLASLARDNDAETAFYGQVHEKGRHADLENRYGHLAGLVAKADPTTAKTTIENSSGDSCGGCGFSTSGSSQTTRPTGSTSATTSTSSLGMARRALRSATDSTQHARHNSTRREPKSTPPSCAGTCTRYWHPTRAGQPPHGPNSVRSTTRHSSPSSTQLPGTWNYLERSSMAAFATSSPRQERRARSSCSRGSRALGRAP